MNGFEIQSVVQEASARSQQKQTGFAQILLPSGAIRGLRYFRNIAVSHGCITMILDLMYSQSSMLRVSHVLTIFQS